ncbi:Branched-chain amino acid transport system / permease component [Acididesulfobacillus acetoxydans]|uniref:Branched-chain amino acid ABC transporter, permease protein n=1 Tax=Acididesulfobacillus acetoxydans TaxID=1561005 RepID=A0A8S0W852_9FIRM|nr:ABC transporter permease [Acididesulfobacillus acetoxydans]CAA7601489.1 Branched-chain amino acid transport system / permease component [Acididesulfobacillus acetoxydans]CEJ06144.1 Branched-chain amino acid ABC transporter, permease protein [Acididesulfobacillus acetoxydans]
MGSKIAELLNKTATKIILAIVLGFMAGALALAVAGYDPGTSYSMMFTSIFSSPQNMIQVLILTMPNILTGLSVAFAFKTGLFNIGGEGQYIVGAIAAVMVGGVFNLPPVINVIVIMLAAFLAAGLYGALAGFLKAKFGIHEVITTIMLNWIALYLNNYLISLPGIGVKNTEYSFAIKQNAWTNVLNGWKTSPQGQAYLAAHPALSPILLGTDINYGIIIAIVVAVAVSFLLYRTTFGYQVRAVGLNKDAAEAAGIRVKKSIVMTMFIAGGLAGLAGALQMTGTLPHALVTLASQPGYGFNGITVALMANSSPIGCIFTALLLSALQFGGSTIQMNLGAPSEVVNIMIGVIVFFVAVASMFTMISERIKRRRVKIAD